MTKTKSHPSFAYACLGKPTFVLARATSEKLNFTAQTPCIQCGCPLIVKYGCLVATFKVGPEFVGIYCDDCLTPESQERLRARRQEREKVR